jgi:hypothetical protein
VPEGGGQSPDHERTNLARLDLQRGFGTFTAKSTIKKIYLYKIIYLDTSIVFNSSICISSAI